MSVVVGWVRDQPLRHKQATVKRAWMIYGAVLRNTSLFAVEKEGSSHELERHGDQSITFMYS